jgi:O-antigen/teichoic acid export membrane protein
MSALRGVGALAAMWFIAPRANVFFAWQILFGVIQLGGFAITFWRCMPDGTRAPHFSVTALRRIWRFTSGMAATGVVSFFLGQINSVLLSKMLPLPALGVFQIANRVNDGAAMLGIPVDVAALPRLALHAGVGDEAALTRVYHEACQLIALLILPAATIVVMFSWGFINAWIGDAAIADQAGPVAALFVIGTILNGLVAMPYRVTLAKGWSMYGFYQNLVAVFIFVPLLYFLIRQRGMIGAAEAWLILNCAFLLISAPIMHRQVLRGQFATWLVQDVAIPAAVTTAFAVALRGILPHHLPRWQFIGAMLGGWSCSVVICGAVMGTTRGTALRLIRSFAARLALI